jgi:hypothetical protein
MSSYTAYGCSYSANGISDQLDDLRFPADGKKLLVNEANLVFHIDATMASSWNLKEYICMTLQTTE